MDDTRGMLSRIISKMRAGADLDKLVSLVLFNMKVEECDAGAEFHFEGAKHYFSNTLQVESCTLPMPKFSTEWEDFKSVMEWVTSKFPAVDTGWDCGKWSCTISDRDAQGRWFRIANSTGTGGAAEAVCKAALLSIVNPQSLPLEIKSRVVAEPVMPKSERKKRKRRRR